MQFGIPTLIELKNLEESVKLCSDLGMNFVELNMNLPDFQVDNLENTEELLKLKEEYNIYYTIHLDENLNVCDFNREVAKAYRNTVKRAIAVAKNIKAPILNMHMNHGVHFTLPDKKVELFEVYKEDYMKSWKHFRAMCEEEIGNSNICICIENTDGFREYEKKAISYLLESNVFALTWDIGHSNTVGNVDEKFIMSHEKRLKHFHIHDGLGKKNHLSLGSGEIDIMQRLRIADKNNCRCVVETKTVQALRDSEMWLRLMLYL